MAVSKQDDVLVDGRLRSRRAVDIMRMLVWAAAALLPWAAIIIVVRWAMTALG